MLETGLDAASGGVVEPAIVGARGALRICSSCCCGLLAPAGDAAAAAAAAVDDDLALSFDLDCFVGAVPPLDEPADGDVAATNGGMEGWSSRISLSMRVSNTSSRPSARPATNCSHRFPLVDPPLLLRVEHVDNRGGTQAMQVIFMGRVVGAVLNVRSRSCEILRARVAEAEAELEAFDWSLLAKEASVSGPPAAAAAAESSPAPAGPRPTAARSRSMKGLNNKMAPLLKPVTHKSDSALRPSTAAAAMAERVEEDAAAAAAAEDEE